MHLQKIKTILRFLLISLKNISLLFGFIFLCLWILSFTDIPYYAYHSLGTSAGKLKKEPDLIVVLGGSGMPSPDGFMRCYYASIAAQNFPASKLIIALPFNQTDSFKQLHMMQKELIIHGVDSLQISFEPYGFNTHSQALNIAQRFDKEKSSLTVLIVTSPEHMYRAVKTFRSAGFKNVGGEPAFEVPSDEEKIENHHNKQIKSLSFRYNMWSYLNYELLVLREYAAIAYYWVMGWI
ncbi:MAG: hypothetical protein Fur0028_01630 [Bacteroidales bacterium]